MRDWLILPCSRRFIYLLRDSVIDGVCRDHHISRRDLMSREKSDHLMMARRIAWRQLRAIGWTYGRIARAFERRPWTVRQSCHATGLPGKPRRQTSSPQPANKPLLRTTNALRGRQVRQYLGDASITEGSVND